MNSNEYFLLYANCIAVKGAFRSTVCDLQKGCYVFVPNIIADLLLDSKYLTFKQMLEKNSILSHDELDAYLKTLMKYDLGHFCKNPLNFPRINEDYKTPYKIHDCILELSEINFENIKYILKSLTNLGCQVLELRSFNFFSLTKIQTILDLLKETRILEIEVYIKYKKEISQEEYIQFSENNPIVNRLVLHSCFEELENLINDFGVVFTKQILLSSNCCGQISKEDFVINLPFYLEGLKNNTCLNRKVSITMNGEIKNCPSMIKSFGKVTDTSIEKIVNSKSFKTLWEINKDDIKVCKDCEFRYICSDCRAYVNGDYDKPGNCKYDPYTATYEV